MRRAESLDLQKRLVAASISGLLSSENTRSLHARFLSCWEKYNLLSNLGRNLEALEMADELEVTRQQLAETSDGIEFLINQMKQLESVVEAVGYMPPQSAILLPACLGFGDPIARMGLAMNSMILKQSGSDAKAEQAENSDADSRLRSLAEELKRAAETSNSDDETAPKTKAPEDNKRANEAPTPEENRKMLLLLLQMKIRRLDMEKQVRAAVERTEAEARRAAAIVADRSDRFLRAETTYERRFYRALVMLMNLRDSGNLASSMPPPPRYARLIQAEPGQEENSRGMRRKVARSPAKRS